MASIVRPLKFPVQAFVKQHANYDEDEHDDDIEARDTQKLVTWHIICIILLPIISVLLLTAIILIPILKRGPPSLLPVDETRTEKYVIKQMMSHAWDAYSTAQWGGDELKPISKGNFMNSDLGITITESMVTLYIMEMEEQFNKCRKWVDEKFDYGECDSSTTVSYYVADTLGAFLSVYHLTKNKDSMFKQQAIKMADEIKKIAFNETTGLTYWTIRPKSGIVNGETEDNYNTIANVGGIHLEFTDLYYITKNKVYKEKVQNIRNYLHNANKKNPGLYPDRIETNTGNWGGMTSSFGSASNRFYEYLLKSFLQSGDTDNQARDMFVEAMQVAFDVMLKSKGELSYLAIVNSTTKSVIANKMEKYACNVGGMLALAASKLKKYSSKYMEVAKKLTNTCHESYIRSNTMLGPDTMSFSGRGLEKSLNNGPYTLVESGNIIESYFIMWRLTKEEKYRDWGWEIAIALQWYCRINSGGYAGLNNVNNMAEGFYDRQYAEFLGKTLKYLYLLFTEDSVLSLEDWVFNAAGHPLPIYKHRTTA